jgi:hypothetical protein
MIIFFFVYSLAPLIHKYWEIYLDPLISSRDLGLLLPLVP